MQTLLTAIVLWLSVNFGLPADYRHPDVVFATPEMIGDKRFMSLPKVARKGKGAQSADIVAIYDDRTETVYLPQSWNAENIADLSVLVHEMVHHLQKRKGKIYMCPEEREKLAFDAQDRWLHLFETNLEEAFGIDPMTRLVRTTCPR